MRRSPKVLLAALIFGMVPVSAEMIPISHEPLACIPVDSSARVAAGTAASEAVSSARVYFRPEGFASDYFVEMRRGTGDNWVGFLPSAASADTVITYRVEMKDSEGRSRRTAPVRVQASATCPVRMSDDDWRTVIDTFVGQLSYVRVLSGTLTPQSELFNTSLGVREMAAALVATVGKKQIPVEKAGPPRRSIGRPAAWRAGSRSPGWRSSRRCGSRR